ncbi:MAG: hypothetical protein Q7S22_05255 [Candidatus Micrarchaeota archaeon]|nr:hypothetical protein [Candidatus Micrarchaeota archaeon]
MIVTATALVTGRPLRRKTVMADIRRLESSSSAHTLALYARKVVPAMEGLRTTANSEVMRIAKVYEVKKDFVRAAVIYAAIWEAESRAVEKFDTIVNWMIERKDRGNLFLLLSSVAKVLPSEKLTSLINKLQENHMVGLTIILCNELISRRNPFHMQYATEALIYARNNAEAPGIKNLAEDILRRNTGEIVDRTEYKIIASAFEKSGQLERAEEAYFNGAGTEQGFEELFSFYERTRFLGSKTNSHLTNFAVASIDSGRYNMAINIFQHLISINEQYPYGNPRGEKEIVSRDEVLKDAPMGIIRCLFLKGEIREGLKMLREMKTLEHTEDS